MEAFSHLREQTDEMLCSLSASGDRSAEEELAVRYSRLVRMCARPYFLAGGDSEDLIQEGMVGLLSAIRGYDAEKGASFRTYAEVCVRNRLRSAMKAAARDKHAPLNTSVPLFDPRSDRGFDPFGYGAEAYGEDPEDVLIGREERQRRIEALRGQLSGFEKTVLEHYLTGLSYQEIAQRVGKSPKSVDNAVQRVRRKVAPFLTSGDLSMS